MKLKHLLYTLIFLSGSIYGILKLPYEKEYVTGRTILVLIVFFCIIYLTSTLKDYFRNKKKKK